MSARSLPQILCVDDEPRILEGLSLHLRKEYEVHLAGSGDEALKKLRALKQVSVIVSDMRMPGMDGATLLAQVMALYPDITRILLTGEPGRETAVSAVNRGNIFRFLTKPCAPDQLKTAVEAGVIHHRVLNAERQMLQETVLGCIKALIDVLALTSPVAFGRASRIKRLAMQFSESLGTPEYWQLEAAAMLSQLGYLSLPTELVEKAYYGEALSVDERTILRGVPEVAIRLLEHIPRLEPVMQILNALASDDEQVARLGDGTIGLATRILGMVSEYDALVAQGNAPNVAVQTLREKVRRYGSELVEQFASHLGAGSAERVAREIPLRMVQPGMTIMQDLRTQMGTLLVPRGFEVTVVFMERIRNYGPDLLAEKIKVLTPSDA
ncbi:MAG: HD domain-containing phosphohydrolase [Gammaproteobacteria bacterium]